MGVCSSSDKTVKERGQSVQYAMSPIPDNQKNAPTTLSLETSMREKKSPAKKRASVLSDVSSLHSGSDLSDAPSLNARLPNEQKRTEHKAGDSEVIAISKSFGTIKLPEFVDDDFQMKQYQARRGHRNSIVEYIESVRRLQNQEMEFISKKRAGTLQADRANVRFLPRGGTYVPTETAGPIQFGLPPETIKDCMNEKLDLPSHYVLPKERFNVQTGINVAEFEFPAYFNFFVLRKRINLIISRDVEPKIRTIFQETLLGPKDIEWPEYFAENCPKEQYPDLAKECQYFRKNPFEPNTELTVDTLLQFTYFEDNVAKLGDHVEIIDLGERYMVREKGEEVATVSGYVILSPPPLRELPSGSEEKEPCFVPPVFGITMLGNSHGFDCHGTTTGMVVWMNRRGIMVDPPPHSGAILKQDGIPSRLIHGIILTHCHADHDAGTFQKILEEGKITLYTTKLIKESFLRKYSAISEMEIPFLEKLFEFRDVIIGDRFAVYGGHLQFHYSLHAIPCVGFTAFCNGKSMIYSGDSLNDPESIDKIMAGGFMSQGRRDSLVNFPWDHSLILHEAGVPPIHTPLKTLTSLPMDVQKRLYVVHIAAKDIPADSGLRPALVGPENTIVITNESNDFFRSQEILDLVTNIDLFEDFPIERSAEILQKAKYVHYPAGYDVIKQDSLGDTMYVIAQGIVSVTVNDELVKKLMCGDHFGEMSIVSGLPRTATVTALTDIHLLEFTGPEFKHLVRGTLAIERLQHLGLMQREESWQCVSTNSVLRSLSSTQKTYLQSILHKVKAKRGEVLWQQGQNAKFAIIVEHGAFQFLRAKITQPFKRGAFVAEMQSLRFGNPLQTTLVCVEDGSFYYITKNMLLKFFDDNPGVLIYFKDKRFVE